MVGERVPTGVEGLDGLIGGGFQRGSLILMAGNPGTGKTTFGAQFICKGASELNEVGVYVSFAEDKKTFFYNVQNHLGRDCEKCRHKGKCRFLDLVTVKEEGVSTVLESILAEVEKAEAKRLVIDSFSAMTQALEKPIEARIILHTLIGKIVRQIGCTTLLVCEIPVGESRIGLGMEEFVADGVILLSSDELDGRLFRDLEIRKLRGTALPERKALFTLSGGFKVFQPFKVKPVEKPERFKPLPDPPTKFSTGSQVLDRILDGGYPKGSMVLVEVDEHVSTLQYHLIVSPACWNFIAKGRSVMVLPSTGVDHKIVKKRVMEGGFTEEELNRLVRVCTRIPIGTAKEPYLVKIGGGKMEEDYQHYVKIESRLMKETGQPLIHVIGADTLLAYYGLEAEMKTLNLHATRTREKGNLCIVILKPGYTELSKLMGAMADVHLKITREHGVLILYGVKPRTGLHVVEMDASKGYPLPQLAPII